MDDLNSIFFIVIGYVALMGVLVVATLILAWTHHPVWATITGVPGFYMAWKAIRGWRW